MLASSAMQHAGDIPYMGDVISPRTTFQRVGLVDPCDGAAVKIDVGAALWILESEISSSGSRQPICTSASIRGEDKFRRRKSARATSWVEIADAVAAGPGQAVGDRKSVV